MSAVHTGHRAYRPWMHALRWTWHQSVAGLFGETLSHHVRKLHVRSWSYDHDSPNGSLGNNHINIQSVVYLFVGRGFWQSIVTWSCWLWGRKVESRRRTGRHTAQPSSSAETVPWGWGFMTTESRSTSFAVTIFLTLIILCNPFSVWRALSLENTDLPNLPWFISLIVMYLKSYPV